MGLWETGCFLLYYAFIWIARKRESRDHKGYNSQCRFRLYDENVIQGTSLVLAWAKVSRHGLCSSLHCAAMLGLCRTRLILLLVLLQNHPCYSTCWAFAIFVRLEGIIRANENTWNKRWNCQNIIPVVMLRIPFCSVSCSFFH